MLLWSGVVIGFAIAAPIGPVNVEIIRRGLAEGFRAAVCHAVAAATRRARELGRQ